MYIKHIEFSPVQPSRTDIGWAKPVKGGFALYVCYNGKWSPLVLMDGLGTDNPDDDQEADISNILEVVKDVVPKILEDTVVEVVSDQMTKHDEAVNNTRNSTSSDSSEYPEITIF